MNAFAVIHPGLEGVVQAELGTLGVQGEVVGGGVRFVADAARVAKLARTMRTPSQLLIELVSGTAKSPDQLTGLLRKVPWKTLLHPLTKLEVDVTSRQSAVRFRDVAARAATNTIRECLKGPFVPDKEARPQLAQQVQIRLDNDIATVSLDAGGELLHRRGWRTDSVKAPLRENLAACLIWLADWRGDRPLLDPFCGSGTIPIEAALLAAGRPPFGRRRFACDEWRGLPREAIRVQPVATGVNISGSDHHAPSVLAAQANAHRAGVKVNFRHLQVSDIEPTGVAGTIVTNPPYGSRLGASVAPVYSHFGRALRERFSGWTAVFLSPQPDLAQRVDRNAERLVHFKNGGIPVGVWAVRI